MARITIGPTCWKELDVIPTAALGSAVPGGYIICRSGGVGWIVSPYSTEVSRNWYCRDDAVTTAQVSASCGDWFVPTVGQLQNPGYCCRTYWDSYSSTKYWSSTQRNAILACYACLNNGGASSWNKGLILCVRAFRCVTY